MKLPRLILVFSCLVFLAIGIGAIVKNTNKANTPEKKQNLQIPIEIDVSQARLSVDSEKKVKPPIKPEVVQEVVGSDSKTLGATPVKEEGVSASSCGSNRGIF